MKKPNSYNETNVGEYTPINLGGHTAVIKRVEETTSKAGKPMIKIAIDFDKADSQPNYFMDSFQNDTREDKKWPFQGTQYIVSEDENGNCSRSFKSFITSVENSNNSECVWGDGFEKWFTNKKVGVVFGEVEEEYNGETKLRRRIRWFCDYKKAGDQSVPEAKLLPNSAPKAASNSFVSVENAEDLEIPF